MAVEFLFKYLCTKYCGKDKKYDAIYYLNFLWINVLAFSFFLFFTKSFWNVLKVCHYHAYRHEGIMKVPWKRKYLNFERWQRVFSRKRGNWFPGEWNGSACHVLCVRGKQGALSKKVEHRKEVELTCSTFVKRLLRSWIQCIWDEVKLIPEVELLSPSFN